MLVAILANENGNESEEENDVSENEESGDSESGMKFFFSFHLWLHVMILYKVTLNAFI